MRAPSALRIVVREAQLHRLRAVVHRPPPIVASNLPRSRPRRGCLDTAPRGPPYAASCVRKSRRSDCRARGWHLRDLVRRAVEKKACRSRSKQSLRIEPPALSGNGLGGGLPNTTAPIAPKLRAECNNGQPVPSCQKAWASTLHALPGRIIPRSTHVLEWARRDMIVRAMAFRHDAMNIISRACA